MDVNSCPYNPTTNNLANQGKRKQFSKKTFKIRFVISDYLVLEEVHGLKTLTFRKKYPTTGSFTKL